MSRMSQISLREYYSLVWIVMLFISLLYSPTLLVISMLMLLFSSFIEINFSPFQIRFFPSIATRIRDYYGQKAYFVISLIFFLSLFSLLNSADRQTWFFFTMMKLPFFLLPFAFLHLPVFSTRMHYALVLFFIALMCVSTLSVIPLLINDPEGIMQSIRTGQSIQTPVDHIKYSLFLSYATIASIILMARQEHIFFRFEKPVLGLIFLYLFLFTHILAVRSGIFILYANLIVLFLLRAFAKKQWGRAIFALIIVLSVPFAAYKTIPTFREKIDYSLLDFRMHRQDRGADYSDGERFRSYEIGWELFGRSPVTGTGVGDVLKEYEKLYEIKYFSKNPTRLPHNQFLTVAVGMGIIGLVFFCLSFFFPFLYRKAYNDPLLLALFVLMLLSFLVENTLERQYSVGFYLVFLLLRLNYIHGTMPLKAPKVTDPEQSR